MFFIRLNDDNNNLNYHCNCSFAGIATTVAVGRTTMQKEELQPIAGVQGRKNRKKKEKKQRKEGKKKEPNNTHDFNK
jgi:hypothetical protein